MKVLLLPYNIANFLTIGLNALNEEPDIEVRALLLADRSHLHDYDGVKVIPWHRKSKLSFKWITNTLSRYYFFIRWVLWADVIHWYWDDKVLTSGLALKIIRWLNKPAIIEFLGSEVRIFKEEFNGNPQCRNHYKEIYGSDYAVLDKKSLALQKKFARAGFVSLSCPEISFFVRKDWFKDNFDLFQRIPTNDFEPRYPSISKTRPLLVHAPSKPVVKGSKEIEEVISKLQEDDKYAFDFDLITGKAHREAISRMSACDIYIDHMGNAGSGYGMAALEAMALGKPVITFIRPKLVEVLPSDMPIIVADPNTLEDKLTLLLTNSKLRNELGIKSRKYVEKYHDTKVLVPQLKKIYHEVIHVNRGLK